MHDQAVENWLYRTMRNAQVRYAGYQWTFYSYHQEPGRIEEAVRDLGGEVIRSPVPVSETRRFIAALHNQIARGGYDVMHAHHDIMSAIYLVASARTPVRRRIVHIHNTALALPTPSHLKKSLVKEPMRRVCLSMADRIVGISQDALASMLGGQQPREGRDVVVYYGVDTSKFGNPRQTVEETRAAIGVASNAKMILFAGRMTEYKNPRFVIDVLAEVVNEIPSAIAVFAGVGPETESVRLLAERTGLSDRIRLLGWRDDLPELMMAADLLLWPGQELPKEGLGLGIVEAQAAGLPIIMSRSVPLDAVVIDELVSVLPLSLGPSEWGREALKRLRAEHPSRAKSLSAIERSHFSLDAGTDNVMALYSDLAPR